MVADRKQGHGGAFLFLYVQDQVVTAAEHPQGIGRPNGQQGQLCDRFGGLRWLVQVAPAHARKAPQAGDHRGAQRREKGVVGVRRVGFPQKGFEGFELFQEARGQLDPVHRFNQFAAREGDFVVAARRFCSAAMAASASCVRPAATSASPRRASSISSRWMRSRSRRW